MRPRIKITGKRGDWNANAGPFGKLTCVHKHWWKHANAYHDPQSTTAGWKTPSGFAEHNKQAIEQRRLLQESRRAIFTLDDVITDAETGLVTGFIRTGYVGIFDLDGFHFDETGTHFRIVGRVADAA